MKWLRLVASVVSGILVAVAVGLLVYAVIGNQKFSHELAHERTRSILRACNDQNARHTNTLVELDRVLAKAARGASPGQRAQIYASRPPTVLMINALAPYQNCQQVLAKSTSTK